MSRRPRRLAPEEEKLWQRVARTASPLDPNKPSGTLSMKQRLEARPKPLIPESDFDIKPFRVGETSQAALSGPARSDEPVDRQVRMDRKAFGRMKRGKAIPEARIDLHGMTAAAAEVALRSFLLRATSEGRRLVLVITGKGRPAPVHDPVPRQTGVLKRAVPEWLTRPPLSHLVLDWTEAHRRHGGSGALYVYLARAR